MKILLKIFFCIAVATTTAAAQNAPNIDPAGFLDARDVNGKRLVDVNKQVTGTPLLNENWGKGQVVFQNGQYIKEVELQFDAYANELRFKKDNEAYVFVNPVKSFSMQYQHEDEQKTVAFRNGYPANQKKTAASFYQVIADGSKVQLLNYISKDIRETQVYSGPKTTEFHSNNQYFVYDAKDGSIKPVTISKSSLLKALPAYADQINKISEEKNFKFKTTSEVVALFNELNL